MLRTAFLGLLACTLLACVTPAPAPKPVVKPAPVVAVKVVTKDDPGEPENPVKAAQAACHEFASLICHRLAGCHLAPEDRCLGIVGEKCPNISDIRDMVAFTGDCFTKIKQADCALLQNPAIFMQIAPSCADQFR